ncbi:MAG: BamA/TamA family outer membrane protein [Gammaproteobacteria bacterium]
MAIEFFCTHPGDHRVAGPRTATMPRKAGWRAPARPVWALVPAMILTVTGGPLLADDMIAQRETTIDVSDALGTDGANALDEVDADLTGNPMSRITENWPEDLVIAPYPSRSPQLGWTLSAMAGYFMDLDEQAENTRPSIVGLFGMYSQNDSYAGGVFSNFKLLGDRLRIKAAALYADVNYRFYGIGSDEGNAGRSVEIEQEMPIYHASAMWRVWGRLYAGVGFFGGASETRLRLPDLDLPLPDPTLDVDMAAFEIPLQYDTRDHQQFPRSGWLVDGKVFLHREGLGSDFDAESYMLTANHYRPVRERDVLALRLYTRTTSGDVPFFLLSTFGGRKDLRGYVGGQYRDSAMYALQAEYRWQFRDRWIATGFAGFGEVAEDLGDFGDELLPAAGVGIRYVISEKHKVSLSADVATGREGTEFYFGVGEAF